MQGYDAVSGRLLLSDLQREDRRLSPGSSLAHGVRQLPADQPLVPVVQPARQPRMPRGAVSFSFPIWQEIRLLTEGFLEKFHDPHFHDLVRLRLTVSARRSVLLVWPRLAWAVIPLKPSIV